MSIVLDIAVTEHAGVDLSYDLQVKNLAKQLVETDREKNKAECLLTEINQTIKNNCLMEFGIIPAYTNLKTSAVKNSDKDKGKGNKDHIGGKGKKQDKRGKHRENLQPDNTWGKNNRKDQPQPTRNDWANNNWSQNTQKSEETPETQPDADPSPKTPTRKGGKKRNYSFPLLSPCRPFVPK